MKKFLLVGCGAVSEVLYKPAFHHIRKKGLGELIAVVDTNLSRAQEYAAEFQAHAYDDLETALKHEKPDAAVVATPHAFHAPGTIRCLEAGLAVLCEKPLAISTAECESMIAAAKRADKTLAVGFFRRNFPSTKAVKLLLEKEELGKVQSFEFLEGRKYDWPAKTVSFFSRKIAGGGVFIDGGAHLIDLLLWWLGDVRDADYADDTMGGVEANCELNLTMESGVTGRIRMSREHPLENRYIIHCERGDLIYACDVIDRIWVRNRETGVEQEYNLRKVQNLGDVQFPFLQEHFPYEVADCFFEQLAGFCLDLNNPDKFISDTNRAKKGIRLIETCYTKRKFLTMPWFSEEETQAALRLSQSAAVQATTHDVERLPRIGVIGAGGFIGYRICEWMILHNRAKVTPIIHSAKNFALLGRFDIRPEFADLLDQQSLEAAFAGRDIIVHAAVGDDKTIVQGIQNTLNAAKKAGVKRIVYLSTICVYGNAPPQGTDESSPLLENQKFAYNCSKVRAEQAIRELRDRLNIDVVILRPLIVWGPRSTLWVLNLADSMRQGTAYLVNKGDGICNCTYIDNLVEAVWLASMKESAKNEDFIIMDNETVTWRQYYDALADACGFGSKNWRYLSDEDLAQELQKSRMVVRKLIVRRLVFKTGATLLPMSLQRKIVQSYPGIAKKDRPMIDENLVSLQSANYKLSSGKAKGILGYSGNVAFSDGMDATLKWFDFIRGRKFR
jgi:predicted dehydrogenase